jgi:hypothetical protein
MLIFPTRRDAQARFWGARRLRAIKACGRWSEASAALETAGCSSGRSRRDVIDHDVDQAVVTDEVGSLTEGITATGQGIA